MTAQAIEGVLTPSLTSTMYNQTSSSSDEINSNSLLINDKIRVATTLALLTGLVQVKFEKVDSEFHIFLQGLVVVSETWSFNCVPHRTLY